MRSFLLALQFLTILPVKVAGRVEEKDVARSSAAFPLVGLLQGLVLVAADAIFTLVFHPDLALALVLLVLVLLSGGFHLDGLADTFDGLASKGDGRRKLEVMREGSVGAMGVIAVVFSLGIKYLALKSISSLTAGAYYLSLLSMPVLSKWAMVIGMFHGRPARMDGLGRMFIEGSRLREFFVGTVLTAFIVTVPVLLLPSYFGNHRHFFHLGALALLYAGARAIYGFIARRLGGLTGDALGAGGEIIENVYLLLVLAWSELYTS